MKRTAVHVFAVLASVLCGTVSLARAQAVTAQVVATFNRPGLHGTNPYAGLVQGSDGRFYGTTYQGGANGYGTVFAIDATGTLATLHSFNYGDGAAPCRPLPIQSRHPIVHFSRFWQLCKLRCAAALA